MFAAAYGTEAVLPRGDISDDWSEVREDSMLWMVGVGEWEECGGCGDTLAGSALVSCGGFSHIPGEDS